MHPTVRPRRLRKESFSAVPLVTVIACGSTPLIGTLWSHSEREDRLTDVDGRHTDTSWWLIVGIPP